MNSSLRTKETRSTRSKKASVVNRKNTQTLSEILSTFFRVESTLRLIHWRTFSIAHHKATDEFLQRFHNWIDRFAEAWIGQGRPKGGAVFVGEIPVVSELGGGRYLRKFRVWVVRLYLTEKDSTMLALRDELLQEIDRALYLFTLK